MALSRRRLAALSAAFGVTVLYFFFGAGLSGSSSGDWQPMLQGASDPFGAPSKLNGPQLAEGPSSLTGEAVAPHKALSGPTELWRPNSAAVTPVAQDRGESSVKSAAAETVPQGDDGRGDFDRAAAANRIEAEAKAKLPPVVSEKKGPSPPAEQAPEMVKRPDGHVVVLSEQVDSEKEAVQENGGDHQAVAEEEMKKEEERRNAEAARKEALMKAEAVRLAAEKKAQDEANRLEALRIAQEEKELAWEAAETGKQWGKYEDVAVIIRTGFQVQKRLEGPLSTYLRDRKDDTVALFSDRESTVLGRRVIDTIKPFFDKDPAVYNETNMRKIYDSIQAMNSDGSEVKPGQHNDGWKLDIMKQTMSADLGYQMLHKNRKFKWWAIIDDDTYLHLPTLSTELSKINHSEPHYFGSPTYYADTHFAHGGSGIVLSAKAMSNLFDNRELADRMHAQGLTTPYGDHNLAVFLKEIGIPFENQFRHSFHGDPLEEVRFKAEQVCAPLFTLHHLQEAAMQATHQVVHRDRLVRFFDVLDAVTDFKDMSLWYKQDHSYNLWVSDYLGLDSEGGKGSDGIAKPTDKIREVSISEKMPVIKIDGKHPEEERPGLCEQLCHSGEISKGCITWTYIQETGDCYLADWFLLNTGRPRKGAVSGILAERLSQWRRAPCWW